VELKEVTLPRSTKIATRKDALLHKALSADAFASKRFEARFCKSHSVSFAT
jgi:hypothetical protein